MRLLQKLGEGVRYSTQGLRFAWKGEPSLRIELGALVIAVLLGWWRHWSRGRWAFVLLGFSLVIAAELLNTAIEALADYVQPKRDRRQASVYDSASAAVFVLVLFTVATTTFALIWPR